MQVSFGKRVTRCGQLVPIIVNVWSFVSTVILPSSRTRLARSVVDRLFTLTSTRLSATEVVSVVRSSWFMICTFFDTCHNILGRVNPILRQLQRYRYTVRKVWVEMIIAQILLTT